MIRDGAISHNLSELETVKRRKDRYVPFVALVNNNSSLSQTRIPLEDWPKEEAPAISVSNLSELDCAKIAEEVQEAFDSGKPAVADVVTDKRVSSLWV